MERHSGIHQRIVESSPDGLWVLDASGHTVYTNSRVGELLGRTESEMAGVTLTDVLSEADRQLLVSESTLYDEQGAPLGTLVRLSCDSRRRTLVSELTRSRSQLAEAQAIAHIGSWEIQVEPRQVTWSEQMYTLLDVPPDIVAPGPEEFIQRAVEADRAGIQEAWLALPTVDGDLTVDARFAMPDGSERWMRTVGRVLERDVAGNPLRFSGTVQDIDDLKRAERQLRDAVQMNTLMQFMATAANETSTLDEALSRLRGLLLADRDWVRGVTFTVVGDDLEWRELADGDDRPSEAERIVGFRALAATVPVYDEESVPGHMIVGFPVPTGGSAGSAVVVVVVTAVSSLAHRSAVGSVVSQVAGQLAQVAAREALVTELSRSRSQLAEAQAIARVGSWEITLDPYEVTWSDQLFDLLGVDRERVVPGVDPFLDQLLDEDRPVLIQAWEEIAASPGERAVDVRVAHPDGAVRWVRAVGRVLEWAPDGVPLRFGGTVQDIQDLKEIELRLVDAVELNTLMQFVATAANETNTLVEALVRTGDLLLAHPDWERGVAFDVVDGALVHRQVGSDELILPAPRERAVAETALAQMDTVFDEESEPDRPMVAFPVVHDQVPLVVLVITNRSPFVRHAMMRSLVAQVASQLAQVAAREATAKELAAARDLAMAASYAKSEFLATMSHEIRTPLNGVIGLNDLLLRTDLDPSQRQLAEAMQGAGRALLVLISDILDFSKIEAGGLELEAVAFQPAVVVEGTLELFAPMAVAKGISLDVELADDVPERLEGDPGRFGQVLSNLVANAVKFTHEGGVHVTISATTVGRATTLKVLVTDTGIGMDEEQLSRIFQPFRQADASTTRNFGGTGLGLAIAHRLATALGGEIGVSSVAGQGSTFWFTGQFRLASTAQRPVPRTTVSADEPPSGGHVLVVEDNEVNQLVAVGMLEVLGYTSEVAADGAAAAARAVGGRFDAVLMDLQMPRLDGFAATRLIRQAEPPGVRVPIIALTASATSGEQERCLASGMTGFLSKPVAVEALGRVLREQLAEARAPGTEAMTRPAIGPVIGRIEPVQEADAVPTLEMSRLDELAEMGAAAAPLIRRAIDNFVQGADDHLDALRRHLAAADAAAVRSAAHRLKGSAANLGALEVAEIAEAIELLAEEEQLGRAAPLLQQLPAALDAVCAQLAAYRFGDEPVSA